MAVIPFNSWLYEFEKSRRGKTALELLDKHFPPDNESEQTRQIYPIRSVVLQSCYAAAMFKPANDPDKKKRLATTRALKARESQIKAIAKLRKYAMNFRPIAEIVFGGTIIDLKNKGIKISLTDGNTRDAVDILDCILETFSSRLAKPIPLVEGGALLSDFVYGCLVYDAAPDGKRNNLPKVETMLLFDLVQNFRLRSEGINVRQIGQSMPKSGSRHIGLAVSFVKATIEETQTKDEKEANKAAHNRLKTFVTKNPSIGYFPWPALR